MCHCRTLVIYLSPTPPLTITLSKRYENHFFLTDNNIFFLIFFLVKKWEAKKEHVKRMSNLRMRGIKIGLGISMKTFYLFEIQNLKKESFINLYRGKKKYFTPPLALFPIAKSASWLNNFLIKNMLLYDLSKFECITLF